jgi:colanic acid biosynthesis glycosyl transferase WcaI
VTKVYDSTCRVFLVTPYFWPEELGCAPHLTDLACALADAECDVDVFTAEPHYPRKVDRDRQRLPASLSQANVRIDRVKLFDRSSGGLLVRLANDIIFALSVVWRRWRVADRSAAALVLAPTLLAVPALRAAGHRGQLVAAVFDIESGLAVATRVTRSRLLSSLFTRIEAWALNRASAVVALTPAMANSLRVMGVLRPITVIPIWPSCPVTPPSYTVRLHAVPTLMYSGGLGRRHGIERLPSIWRALTARLPAARLIVQGDGAERDATFEALQMIGGEIVMRPPVPREAHANSLQSADLQLVLQLPNAAAYSVPSKAVTCVAVGVPFVTNAAPDSALAAFARDSGAGLVAADDPESIAGALYDLLTDSARRQAMRSAAYRFASEFLRPETSYGTYHRLLCSDTGGEAPGKAPGAGESP